MKNIKLLIILTIIFFVPFCLIAGIKCFICGIIEQAECNLQDIKHAIKQKKRIKTKQNGKSAGAGALD